MIVTPNHHVNESGSGERFFSIRVCCTTWRTHCTMRWLDLANVEEAALYFVTVSIAAIFILHFLQSPGFFLLCWDLVKSSTVGLS